MSFNPQYTITNNILKHVGSIEASKEIIENSLIVPKWIRTFQSQAIVRTVHYSTAIEGNSLRLDQAEKLVQGQNINSTRIRDIREILNYRDVIAFISGLKKKKLTIGLVKRVHKILGKKILSEIYLGRFRKNKAVIINSKNGKVVFDAPGSDEIFNEINELISWYNFSKTLIHPLIKAGILHFEIVRIHPFIDINGRTARAITTWSLYNDGYDIYRFFSLEEYYDQNLKLYYNALESAHDGDMTEWLEYFIYGVKEELLRIKEKVLKLSRDRKLKQKLGQIALNERQIGIIEFIEEKDKIENPDFNELFPKVSDDTILRDLKDLIQKGILVKRGKTKAASYILK